MPLVHTVQVTSACENMHLTTTRMISPVVNQAEGSAEGSLGSDAAYCPVCDSSEMTGMDSSTKQEELTEDEARVWAVVFV